MKFPAFNLIFNLIFIEILTESAAGIYLHVEVRVHNTLLSFNVKMMFFVF